MDDANLYWRQQSERRPSRPKCNAPVPFSDAQWIWTLLFPNACHFSWYSTDSSKTSTTDIHN